MKLTDGVVLSLCLPYTTLPKQQANVVLTKLNSNRISQSSSFVKQDVTVTKLALFQNSSCVSSDSKVKSHSREMTLRSSIPPQGPFQTSVSYDPIKSGQLYKREHTQDLLRTHLRARMWSGTHLAIFFYQCELRPLSWRPLIGNCFIMNWKWFFNVYLWPLLQYHISSIYVMISKHICSNRFFKYDFIV